jgi:hypothetical protein
MNNLCGALLREIKSTTETIHICGYTLEGAAMLSVFLMENPAFPDIEREARYEFDLKNAIIAANKMESHVLGVFVFKNDTSGEMVHFDRYYWGVMHKEGVDLLLHEPYGFIKANGGEQKEIAH